MTDRADIAVVVPTHRHPELLPRLVDALEHQTLDPRRFEVVIVDDGSGDDTSSVLDDLARRSSIRVRPLVLSANVGPAAARNLAWRSTATPYLAFTDDDCVPEPRWLECGLYQLEADSEVGIVQGRTLKPDDRDYPYTEWTVYREVLGPSPWFEGCNLFFRRGPRSNRQAVSTRASVGTARTRRPVGGRWPPDGSASTTRMPWCATTCSSGGVRWHMERGWGEGTLLELSARFPALRHEGFWRPWAVRPLNVAFAVGVIGTAVSPWRRVGLLAWIPWLAMRRPPIRSRSFFRLLGERFAVDAVTFAGMKVAAVRHRQPVL